MIMIRVNGITWCKTCTSYALCTKNPRLTNIALILVLQVMKPGTNRLIHGTILFQLTHC